ncbi:MAG TPA: MFS transporter [Actinopolymorphaceae bacterium]
MQSRNRLASYLLGATTARVGDEMSGPALLLLGLAVTGSTSTASALLAGLTFSAAVGGPLFGVILDRSPRPGRILAGALTAYALALMTIWLLLGTAPVAAVVAIALAAGLLGPALSGGWTARLPQVVGATPLGRATVLDAMTFDVGTLVGPVLAGLVAALVGAPAAVVTAAGLIALAVPVAWSLPDRPVGLDPPTTTIGTDLVAGARTIVRSVPLLRATVASTVSSTGLGLLVVAVPMLGEDVFGDRDLGPVLLGVTAAAALVANAALARRPASVAADTVLWLSCLLLAVGLSLAATRSPVVLVVAVVLVGIAEGPQLTALFTVRHREAPERLRSQIFTTGASLKVTGYAVGAAIAGPIVTWSVPGALLVGAGLQLLAAACFAALTLVSRTRRVRPPSDPAASTLPAAGP